MLIGKLLVQYNASWQNGNQASNPVNRETGFQNKYRPLVYIWSSPAQNVVILTPLNWALI